MSIVGFSVDVEWRSRWTITLTLRQKPFQVRGFWRRYCYGTMSLRGSLLVHDTDQCNQEELQIHLRMIRSLWRGWNIVLFLERAPSHTAEESLFLADELDIALRWL